ncbi:MAG: polysaccharide biosynthesis C-terminal domain-containing protein [Cytophagaceae bacterium]|jgi:O-antigen/teichoic acid export membrane protein|nr:polysaccharide biosynthesis C-terminal domain-containing protein [Cytophagaceae bacterium]
MGIIIRQSFKGTIVSFTGAFLGAVNMLWVSPKFLSPSEIGTISFLESAATSLMSIGSLGIIYISDRYFPQFKTEDHKHAGFPTFLLAYLFLGFLFTSLVYLLGQSYFMSFYEGKRLAVDYVSYFIPVLFFFLLFMALLETFSRAYFRIVVPSFNREVLLRLLGIILVLAYAWWTFDFTSFLVFRIAMYALATLVLFFYLKNLKMKFTWPDFSILTKEKILPMIKYGLIIMIGGIASVLIIKIDALLIPAFLDVNMLGIYSISFFIGGILEIPRKSIAQISIPVISKAWNEQDFSTLSLVYKKSALNQMIVGAWIFMGIWFNVDSIFTIMPNGSEYQAGKYVIFWIALARLVDMATGVNNEIILQSKYFTFNLLVGVFLAIINVGANVLLIPVWGITGAAISIFVSFTLFNLVRFIFIWKKLGMQPFDKSNLYICLLVLACAGINELLPTMSHYLVDVVLRSVIVSVLFIGSILYFRISPDLNQLTIVLYQKIFSFRIKK